MPRNIYCSSRERTSASDISCLSPNNAKEEDGLSGKNDKLANASKK